MILWHVSGMTGLGPGCVKTLLARPAENLFPWSCPHDDVGRFLGCCFPQVEAKFYFEKERPSFHTAWVTGCRCDYVGITAGLPQIAADSKQRETAGLGH